ncbi:MAG: glycoside hydrolase family 44 protein [bacterium]
MLKIIIIGVIVIFILRLFFIKSANAQDEKQNLLKHYTITQSGEEVKKVEAEISVEVNKPYLTPDSDNNGMISPHLYGSNWASWFKFSPSAEEVTRPLELKVIRLGGNQMSRSNWRTSKLTFPLRRDVESQPASIDNFVQTCHDLGAEPLIQINAMGWAPNDKNNDIFEKCLTERDAVDLIIYLNKTKGYNVKYFEIDNEPELWYETHSDVFDKEVGLKEYTEIFKKYAYALKKAQAEINSADNIKIFGPVVSKSEHFFEVPYFLDECLKFEKDKVKNPQGYRILDVLSFHYYSLYRTDWKKLRSLIPEGTPAMLESVQTWWNPSYVNRYDRNIPLDETAGLIPQFHKYIKKHYPGLELAITEISVDSSEGVKFEPVMEPIYMADLWGIMAKYGIDYAMPQWVKHNDRQFGLTGANGSIRPTYYSFMLYSQHFRGKVLIADSNKSDLLNIYACDDENGNIVLMVVNKDNKDYATAINLIGYEGTAIKNKFYINSRKYSLTCIKIPQDKKSSMADVWTYEEEQIVEK